MRTLKNMDVERWMQRSDTAIRRSDTAFLSVVVPIYNESANVCPLVGRLGDALSKLTDSYEILLVSDGSDDGGDEEVARCHQQDARVKLLRLSRNFGHQQALRAGLDHAQGQIVVTMDGDLQHPPESIEAMVSKWQAGADVVHAVRRRGPDKGFVGRLCQKAAYSLLTRWCGVDLVPNSADFKLFDRRVVNVLRTLPERGRFTRGLVRWVGFRQEQVEYDERPRHAGRVKYSFAKSFALLSQAVFSLSNRPMRWVGLAASMLVLGAVCVGLSVVAATYWGWGAAGDSTSILASPWVAAVAAAIMLLCTGVQLAATWLLGQYLTRAYDEVKARPPYVIDYGVGLGVRTIAPPRPGRRVVPPPGAAPRKEESSTSAARPRFENRLPSRDPRNESRSAAEAVPAK